MFFSQATELSKITTPTAQIVAQSKPSLQGQALLTQGMSPGQYLHALEKNKLSVDSVHFLAHGLPQKDSICWACQSSRLTAAKMSGPEMDALRSTEAWLKNPSPDASAALKASLGKVDYTGPGSWTAQSAVWSMAPAAAAPGMPAVNLTASAVAGAILLAAGLNSGPAMPAVPQPKLSLPTQSIPQAQLPKFAQPAGPGMPVVDQSKMMKPLHPFLDLGKGVGNGNLVCS